MTSIVKHDSVDWIVSEDLDSKNIIWLPIFTIEFDKDYKRIFGLTSEGYWMNLIIRDKDEMITVSRNKREYLGIITALHKDRDELEKLVKEGLDKYTSGNYSIDIFPFVDLIKFAFQDFGFGGFWADRALDWLRQEDLDQELCLLIKEIIDKKGMDQKSRHYLFKLMKRYERSFQ
uniref:Uncharacterized protein n=1 Tax=Roseihalotalea indica TaxID=2867963 RepID=A0AA49GQR3_9BACT|nr:hypothetical protein K4G66_05945 [Tunicatimonas sp. TK19036]